MNKKLLNTQIEAHDESDVFEIAAFYEDHGFKCEVPNDGPKKNSKHNDRFRYWGVNSYGLFNNRRDDAPCAYKIKTLTLEEARALVADEYPKVMWVWDLDHKTAEKSVVFMEKNDQFLVWDNAETLEEAKGSLYCTPYNYASDQDPRQQPKKMTVKEIAEKLGHEVEIVEG